MTVGIAVCTYRRPDGLARLLAALPQGCGGYWPLTVFVIDNDGSAPSVARIVAAARAGGADVRLVVETAPGISAARNRALAEAEAAGVLQLAMIDDDEWPRPGWLEALLACQRATGAVVTGGVVEPCFPPDMPARLRRLAPLWAVAPQVRGGRAFVFATSNVLLDLGQLRDVPRPLFDAAFGLSGGGDLVAFSRLAALGKPMAWAEDATVVEEVPPARASFAWLRQRRFRVGNHMVIEETLRAGAAWSVAKTFGLMLRLPVYPLLGREKRAPLRGWWLEAAKLRGRIAAHRGIQVFEYGRDGVTLRPLPHG
jgi:succinoglycan biosynthesis protein ExoM